MTSWAVILKPYEAFFCPVVPKSYEPEPDLTSVHQVRQLLGEELANDPQIRTSIWYNRRIEVGWPRNRTDILQKIQECLQNSRIPVYACDRHQKELITHRLSEDVYELYRCNVRLTTGILKYLAANVLLDRPCITDICSLKGRGFSEEKIEALAEKNIVNEALHLLDHFHKAGISQPKECVQQLTQHRLHFNEVYEALSLLSRKPFKLTATICEELVAKPGFGARLAKTCARLSLIQSIEDLFVGNRAQVDRMIWIINRLPDHFHFSSDIWIGTKFH